MKAKKHVLVSFLHTLILTCAGLAALGILATAPTYADTYDPGLGTLPDAQGFGRIDNGIAPNPTVFGGVLYQNTSANDSARQYWYKFADCAFDFSTGFSMEANLKVISSGYIPDTGGGMRRGGYEIGASDNTGRFVSIVITSFGLWLDTSGTGSAPPAGGTFFTPFDSTTGFNNYRLVTQGSTATLFINGLAFLSTPLGPAVLPDHNAAAFGDNAFVPSGKTGSQTELAFFRFGGDTLPPTIACPADVVVAADNGSCSATQVSLGTPVVSDNCALASVTNNAPASFPLGETTVTWTATDSSGNTATCAQQVTVVDTTAPTITCPADLSADCSVDRLMIVVYASPVANDNCDALPTVTCTPASGSASFPVGTTTVVCKAMDAAGNTNTCSFTVTRAPLGFTGFLSPIGGEVAQGTGGSFADPVRAFKLGSTIPIKFQASCSGNPLSTGVHTLQATKYSSTVDSDPAIDATPTDAATTGNQFRLTDAATGEWHFNLDTKSLSVGTWKLAATLSDGSTHEVWITIKK